MAAASGTAFAQAPAPRQKGPRVWLDLDQQELDDAYDQSKYAPNIQQVLKRYEVNSEDVRARLGAPKRLAYGASPVEGFDLYPARGQNVPIHVFVHGGAWRVGFAKNYAFQAETFVRAGAHFITLDFTNVVETKGDLMPMAEQVRRALAWIHKNAASFAGDASRIHLSGHSSGGHLAGVLLTTDWPKEFGLPKDIIKVACAAPGCSTSSRRGSRRARAMSSSPTRSSTRSRRSVISISSTVR